MFAFSGLDAVYWLIGLLVTCCVVTVVVVLPVGVEEAVKT